MVHFRASARLGCSVVKLALMVSIAYEQITAPPGVPKASIRGVSAITVGAGR
jgi:hypothetical protein